MKLNKVFIATLQKSPAKRGHIYIIWPESVRFFETRGLVRVKGTIDNYPFQSAFMAMGDGNHKLPVKLEVRRAVNKEVGDEISVQLTERLN